MMIVVAIIGVLAASASRVYLGFLQKAKTTEAPLMLKEIAQSAFVYYGQDHISPQGGGSILPKQFPHIPDFTPPTPNNKPCYNNQTMFRKNAAVWKHETWGEINFAIHRNHYYQYRIVSTGTGKDATFSAEARGDLDCDNVISRYQLRGEIDPTSGAPTLSGMLIQNDTE